MDRYKMDPNKDALFRGEFEVIKELVAELGADGEGSKRECDKVIDKNGPAKTGGTGIKQLRENIAESKLSYEIMEDAASDEDKKNFSLTGGKVSTPADQLKLSKPFVQ